MTLTRMKYTARGCHPKSVALSDGRDDFCNVYIAHTYNTPYFNHTVQRC